MALSLRDLRRKIKSVTGTKKLTSAMQMVSASKMQKAIKNAQLSREYSHLSWEIIQNIKNKIDTSNFDLLKDRTVTKTAIILTSSNRGLCGSLNAQLFKKLSNYIKDLQSKKINFDIYTIGNKAKSFTARFYKDNLIADYTLPERIISYNDILDISNLVISEFKSKKYDEILIFYNHFKSTLVQKPISRKILPIANSNKDDEWQMIINKDQKENNKLNESEYLFEPNVSLILEILLPTVIKTQIYQILLESNASEHSARMIAMKNATDNANNLIDDLTLTYNSMRQAAITSEINEIAGGAEALKSK
jgi:F-type H+-transporting ATPase subunit gamma